MPFTAYCTGAEAFWQTPVRGPEWPNSSMTMTMVSSKHSMWCRQGTASIQGSGGQNTCVWWVAQDLRSWHVELRGPFQPAGVLLSSAIRFSLMAADCPGCSTASSLIGAGRAAFPRPEEPGFPLPARRGLHWPKTCLSAIDERADPFRPTRRLDPDLLAHLSSAARRWPRSGMHIPKRFGIRKKQIPPFRMNTTFFQKKETTLLSSEEVYGARKERRRF